MSDTDVLVETFVRFQLKCRDDDTDAHIEHDDSERTDSRGDEVDRPIEERCSVMATLFIMTSLHSLEPPLMVLALLQSRASLVSKEEIEQQFPKHRYGGSMF